MSARAFLTVLIAGLAALSCVAPAARAQAGSDPARGVPRFHGRDPP